MTDPRREDLHGADPHAHGDARSEEDRISSGPIIAVGVGSLVVFFLASWVTVAFLRVREGERPPLPVPPEIGSSKIALVEQQLFDLSTRGEKDRVARQQRLGSYGWVDRRTGVVHIPIERAMELSAQGARPRPGGGATPGGQP